ncbi:Mitochondrial translocator assembly and maintenance protein 41 [Serendipita sp. 405]|nr:Mitochondrial translocator assembly and maintenance protein 41 [Serendipita sp. 397]KAG8852558.1 Mitochondrial translocator assembly and maintenance protein 41 [Serendipita sp. 405]
MIHAARRSARFVRCLSTETASSPSPDPSHLPPQPRPQARQQPRSSLTPRKAEPASSSSSTSSTISSNSSTPLRLPRDFGRNQLLSVPNSTRALLEEIVATFKSPIRYAFAYGSGVFEQEGSSLVKDKKPMLDFIFAVSHPEHWHSINLAQNPSHYALHARVLGSDFVGRVQNWGPAAVWFNPFVPVCDVVRLRSANGPMVSRLLTDRFLDHRTSNTVLFLSIIYAPIFSLGIHSMSPVACTSRYE